MPILIHKNEITQRLVEEVHITTDKIFSHLDSLTQWKRGDNLTPITVEVHLTDLCNNQCFYCHYPKSPTHMSLEDFNNVIQKLASVNTKAVILSGGGEPSMNPIATEAIRAIKSGGMDAALITNLLIHNDDLFQSIVENCSWCRISVDSSYPELYSQIRGVDGFKKVHTNIQRLVKFKRQMRSETTIGIQSVVNKYNEHDILDEIRMAGDLGVDYIQIRPVESMPGEDLEYTKEQYNHVMQQIENGREHERDDFKIIRSSKWDVINPYCEIRTHGFSVCHGYMMFAAVDVRGDVYVCCHKIEDRVNELSYGNLINEPIEDILNRRRAVIKNVDLSKCYLECRASNINRRLESLNKETAHVNFL